MDLLGKTLGNYRIDRLIKEGSIGTVYQAYDLSMQRDVAVKVIHARFAHQPGFRERFPGEVSAAAQLNHPGITKVLDFGQHKDYLYIVMEYIPGANLRQLLDELIRQREWLSLHDAVPLVEQLCQTLEYAHQQEALFWDLDPANLMFKPEPAGGLPFRAVLIDLQLARLLKGLEIDQEEIRLGNPAYMSPEEVLGDDEDPRSHVYSLGILLYELVVGLPPFPIRTISEALLYHAREVTPSPRAARPDLPEGLERVMMKALEKAPVNRYHSAAEFGSALSVAMADVTEIVEVQGAQDGNLFNTYQASLSEPPTATSLIREPVTSGTELQPVLATEPMDSPPRAQISIQVFLENNPPQTFTFEKDSVTIGRDRDNDLILNDPKISRRHAQITWDGTNFFVTDLNSANGTSLENIRVQAGAPTIWRPYQQLQIGGASLRLMAHVPTGTVAENYGIGPRTAVDAFEGEPLVMTVAPQQLTVEAGDSVTATLSLLNQTPNPDYFTLSLTGIPNDWVSSLPSHVQLTPGEQKITPFTLHVPKEPQSRAGRHSISLRAASQTDPSQSVELKITLTVAPFSQFRAELQPPRLQAGHLGRITITNLGNIQELYTVRFTDSAGELAFQPPQIQIRILEGRSAYAEFMARENQRRVIGGEKNHAISAYVSSPNADPQAVHAEVLSQGLFPTWVLPGILLLCLFTAGAVGTLWYYLRSRASVELDSVITSKLLNASNATFSFTGTDGSIAVTSFECQLDTAGFTACTSPMDYVNLSDGSHTFEVRAKDARGRVDQSPASFTWSTTNTALDTTIVGTPSNLSNSGVAAFVFSGVNSGAAITTFECKLDNGSFSPCASPASFPNLADGSHTFEVRAKDAAGNTDQFPARFDWTVDTTAPDTTMINPPPNPGNSPTFSFSAPDATSFECQLDTSGFAGCTSPITYANLIDGSHTFQVRAKDAAGNVDQSPASFTWLAATGAQTGQAQTQASLAQGQTQTSIVQAQAQTQTSFVQGQTQTSLAQTLTSLAQPPTTQVPTFTHTSTPSPTPTTPVPTSTHTSTPCPTPTTQVPTSTHTSTPSPTPTTPVPTSTHTSTPCPTINVPAAQAVTGTPQIQNRQTRAYPPVELLFIVVVWGVLFVTRKQGM